LLNEGLVYTAFLLNEGLIYTEKDKKDMIRKSFAEKKQKKRKRKRKKKSD
jgi:hypothetical protein